MAYFFPPTPLRVDAVYNEALGNAEHKYFEFNNSSRYHVLVQFDWRNTAMLTAPDAVIKPYTTQTVELPAGTPQEPYGTSRIAFIASSALPVAADTGETPFFSYTASGYPINLGSAAYKVSGATPAVTVNNNVPVPQVSNNVPVPSVSNTVNVPQQPITQASFTDLGMNSKLATAAPNTYPQGFSTHARNDGTTGGWPGSGNVTALTIYDGAYASMFQIAVDDTGAYFIRSSNASGSGWQSWNNLAIVFQTVSGSGSLFAAAMQSPFTTPSSHVLRYQFFGNLVLLTGAIVFPTGGANGSTSPVTCATIPPAQAPARQQLLNVKQDGTYTGGQWVITTTGNIQFIGSVTTNVQFDFDGIVFSKV